jgi:4-oxalocrotonate tautomerase
MPIVQIHLHSGRDDNKKRKLVAEVTKAICTSLNVLPEKVSIILLEMAPENFAKGGVLAKDLKNSVNMKTDNKDLK